MTNSKKTEKPIVDMTGNFVMSWKSAAIFLVTVVVFVSGWGAFFTMITTDDELDLHVDYPGTHKIALTENGKAEPITDVLIDHEKSINELDERVDTQETAIVTVKNGFFDDRAERLADRAADKIKNRRQSRDVWKRVKAKALNNLETKKPIRDGLDHLL
jgi:hypothetical protein